MGLLTKLYVRITEKNRGQTMTEYALILAAVAIIVVAGYRAMGTTVTTMLTTVDSQL